MIMTSFDYPEWLDENSERIKLKDDTPEEIRKLFEEWQTGYNTQIADE